MVSEWWCVRASLGADQFGRFKAASAYPELALWLVGLFELRVVCGRIQGAYHEGPLVFTRPRVRMLTDFPSFSLLEWVPDSRPALLAFKWSPWWPIVYVACSLCSLFALISVGMVGGEGQQDKEGSSTCRVLTKETFKLSRVAK